MAELETRGLSARRVRHARATLLRALRDAQRHGLVTRVREVLPATGGSIVADYGTADARALVVAKNHRRSRCFRAHRQAMPGTSTIYPDLHLNLSLCS